MKGIFIKLLCSFIPLKKYKEYARERLENRFYGNVVSIKVPNARGNVLISYLRNSVKLGEQDELIQQATCPWENRAIARVFGKLGYNVDCCSANQLASIKQKYDIVLDINGNFFSCADGVMSQALKIHYVLDFFDETQERERLDYYQYRHGETQLQKNDEQNSRSQADAVFIIGNEVTKQAYCDKDKKTDICLLTKTILPNIHLKTAGECYPREREFLWIGQGHPWYQGLDIVLDVFAKHPEWTLNIVTEVGKKEVFYKLYKKEMCSLPNIHVYPKMLLSSEKFTDLAERCFALVYPSCCETTQEATLSVIAMGLYPIVSRGSGITLPEGCGIVLENCREEYLEKAIAHLWHKNSEHVRKEIKNIQKFVLENYSKKTFQTSVYQAIVTVLTKFEQGNVTSK